MTIIERISPRMARQVAISSPTISAGIGTQPDRAQTALLVGHMRTHHHMFCAVIAPRVSEFRMIADPDTGVHQADTSAWMSRQTEKV